MPPQWLSYTPDQKPNILQTIVNSAAKEGFLLRRPEIRKPYLSNTTFQLVEKLASLAQPSQAEQRRLLRNRVKKLAKRDKKIWWNLKFCQHHRSHPSQQWKSVKQVRSNFAPRPVNIRDIWGYSDPAVELKFLPNICKPKFGHQKIYRSPNFDALHHRPNLIFGITASPSSFESR